VLLRKTGCTYDALLRACMCVCMCMYVSIQTHAHIHAYTFTSTDSEIGLGPQDDDSQLIVGRANFDKILMGSLSY